MDDKNKIYLGDGAYAKYDGYSIVVFTSNGIEETNEIYLEPRMIDKLIAFSNSIYKPNDVSRGTSEQKEENDF